MESRSDSGFTVPRIPRMPVTQFSISMLLEETLIDQQLCTFIGSTDIADVNHFKRQVVSPVKTMSKTIAFDSWQGMLEIA